MPPSASATSRRASTRGWKAWASAGEEAWRAPVLLLLVWSSPSAMRRPRKAASQSITTKAGRGGPARVAALGEPQRCLCLEWPPPMLCGGAVVLWRACEIVMQGSAGLEGPAHKQERGSPNTQTDRDGMRGKRRRWASWRSCVVMTSRGRLRARIDRSNLPRPRSIESINRNCNCPIVPHTRPMLTHPSIHTSPSTNLQKQAPILKSNRSPRAVGKRQTSTRIPTW